MASERSDRLDKNVKRRQLGVMKKADGVYLMDHNIMASAAFLDGNNLYIYESTDDWLLRALQDGNLRVIRTVPKQIRLAHVHEEAKKEEGNVSAQAPQPSNLGLGMDQLPPTVPEESLFVPATGSSTPGGRRQLRSRASPRVTPRKRNYGFDTDAESEGEA